MSEREWQPGASDTGDARGERPRDPTDVDRDDARNVEGVQGPQGGRDDESEGTRERVADDRTK